MSVPLSKATFEPLLNSKFKVTFDSENTYSVELIQIEEGTHIKELNITPFTLTFRGGRDEKIFAQSTYTVSSEATGDLRLFMIPRLPDDEGIYYHVIFS